MLTLSGERHWNYKGNESRGIQTKRNWSAYREFKREVHSRDSNKCVSCGSKERPLHAHHLIKWSEDESLRFNPKNAITLCKKCHRDLHSFCGQVKLDLDKQKEWLDNRKIATW